MGVFEQASFDAHEEVSFIHDPRSGLRAIVAIHTTKPLGFAGGGCRMWPYATSDEALDDALRLSRTMTYKHALADTPAGGGKAVVIGDPATEKSDALFRALGRAVERLGGRFIIAVDVGTSPEDMRTIGLETKYVVGKRAESAAMTAQGVLVAMRTAVKRRLGSRGLAGLRVAIQGAGRVAGVLAHRLAREGAELWIADVDDRRALELAREIGAKVVDPNAIYDLEVDVLAPCALGAVLNARTIPRLRCSVVAGAANNQLADEHGDGEALSRRGILHAPDLVANMGGMISAGQEGLQLAGEEKPLDEDLIAAQTERIAEILSEVFERAERDAIGTQAAAILLARERLRALQG